MSRNAHSVVLSSKEVEFLAEDTLVSITPKFELDSLAFIGHSYGPFLAGVPTIVPIWLAVQLRKANKCDIKLPEWMEPDRLATMLQREQDDENAFGDIHPHYEEISAILLNDVEVVPHAEASRIRSLISDIVHVRNSKIRHGLQEIQTGLTSLRLNNVGAMELNVIRPLVITALNEFRALESRDLVGTEAAVGDMEEEEPLGGGMDDGDDDLGIGRTRGPQGQPPRRLRKFRQQ